jgi:hypothetical protein
LGFVHFIKKKVRNKNQITPSKKKSYTTTQKLGFAYLQLENELLRIAVVGGPTSANFSMSGMAFFGLSREAKYRKAK